MKNAQVVGIGKVKELAKDEVLGMIIPGKWPPGATQGPGAMAAGGACYFCCIFRGTRLSSLRHPPTACRRSKGRFERKFGRPFAHLQADYLCREPKARCAKGRYPGA